MRAACQPCHCWSAAADQPGGAGLSQVLVDSGDSMLACSRLSGRLGP